MRLRRVAGTLTSRADACSGGTLAGWRGGGGGGGSCLDAGGDDIAGCGVVWNGGFRCSTVVVEAGDGEVRVGVVVGGVVGGGVGVVVVVVVVVGGVGSVGGESTMSDFGAAFTLVFANSQAALRAPCATSRK